MRKNEKSVDKLRGKEYTKTIKRKHYKFKKRRYRPPEIFIAVNLSMKDKT